MNTRTMGPIRAIIMAVLLVILIINIMGIQLGYALNSTILKPTFLMKTFKEQHGYAQFRNVIFRLVGTSLPNGQESIPYLEKAMTEDWLENEINTILKNFYDFAKGNREDLPIISFASLKKRVADTLDENKSYQEKISLVQYWFDPLPDEVRFEDFLSIDTLWETRQLVKFLVWIPWVFGGVAIITLALLYVVLKDWKDMILWIGAAITSGGALLILTGLLLGWARKYMSILVNITQRIIDLQIPDVGASNLINSFIFGIMSPINVMALISITVGACMICFAPIDERVLTLIK